MTVITINIHDPALTVNGLRSVEPDRAIANRLANLIEKATEAIERPQQPDPGQTGAVVRDSASDLWVWCSAGATGAFWRRVGYPEDVWRHWIHIPPPVTILSDGVTDASPV